MDHTIPVKKWFSGLHVLRAVLFILIYLSHSSAFFRTENMWGGAGVETFFVLSGFMSAKSFLSAPPTAGTGWRSLLTECWQSLWKKALSFYPLYILFQFVGLPTRIHTNFLPDFIKCVFLTQSYWFNLDTACAFNPPAWFLSSIMLCFFLAPVLNRIGRKISAYALPVIFLGIFPVLCAWAFFWRNVTENFGPGHYYVYIFPPVRVLDFAAGILVYYIYIYISDQEYMARHGEKYSDFAFLPECAVLLFYCGELILYRYVPKSFQLTVIWLPVSVALIVLFALQNTPIVCRMSEIPVLIWLGNCSFELFIVHRLVLSYFAHVDTGLISWAMAGFSTALTAYAAHSLMKIGKSRLREKMP